MVNRYFARLVDLDVLIAEGDLFHRFLVDNDADAQAKRGEVLS